MVTFILNIHFSRGYNIPLSHTERLKPEYWYVMTLTACPIVIEWVPILKMEVANKNPAMFVFSLIN